jgi:hypothetical protein
LNLARHAGVAKCGTLIAEIGGNATASHRETRGQYLIEASACRIPGESKWQPRLIMTRQGCGNLLSKSQSFPGLAPLFETAKGAVGYATELGRRMIDEQSPRLTV